MIETTYRDYLLSVLDGIPVLMEEPEAPPHRYIVLQKTGSSRENQIRSATFAVRSYGSSLLEAAELNDRVVDITLAMTPADGVFSAELNSDYEYTDTETKQYRYQAVLVIYY